MPTTDEYLARLSSVLDELDLQVANLKRITDEARNAVEAVQQGETDDDR